MTTVTTTSPSRLRFQEVHNTRLELRVDTIEHINGKADVLQVFKRSRMHKASQETFWCLAYGTDLRVATLFEVNRGGATTVDLHIPSLLGGVLTAGVERFCLAHNHPTSVAKPSKQDIEVTRSIMEAANTVRLSFEDHLILTPDGSYFSFTENGIIELDEASPYRADAAAGR